MFVSKIHERAPVVLGERMPVVRIIDPEATGGAKVRVGRSCAYKRAFDGIGEGNLVGSSFQGDEWSWGHQREEPMFVEWQFVHLPPEFMQVW